MGGPMRALESKVSRSSAVVAALLATALFGWMALDRTEEAADFASPVHDVGPGLVRLDSPEGARLLFDSEAHAAFLPLMSHFETQHSLTYCGVASIAMVLNALEIPAPAATAYTPYRIFTQDNVLSARTDGIVTPRAVSRRGMALSDVARVLETYGMSVDTHYAGTSDLGTFRRLAIAHLDRPGRHVIVNYSRPALGQEGPGHISPLGAYDAESDRFLILDVSRYKAPAVWVEASQLFAAMAEPLGAGTARTRGFLLVRMASETADAAGAGPPG